MRLQKATLSGDLLIPPSKSDGQRAVLAAGLSKGTSLIQNLGPSDDEQQMLKNIQVLGAKVEKLSVGYQITGIQSLPQKGNLNLGESGLGFRLIGGLCAVIGGEWKLVGEGTLPTRPMTFFKEQFEDSGLNVQGEKAPLTFSGKSTKRKFEIDGSQGSQFLSGLLMALPLVDGESVIEVRNLKSTPYIDMTINVLADFGIEVTHENYELFKISGGQKYQARAYKVESDWSSASCWLAAAACGHSITLAGLNPQSLQADKAMLNALMVAGCKVQLADEGLQVDGTQRCAFEFDANDCPDLFPALAVLAALSPGTSKIKGLNRLAIKESDRGVAIQKEWSKLGIEVQLFPEKDEMHILGAKQIVSAKVSAHHDHRIAMALGILSTLCEDNIELEGAESVAKSYPEFWAHLQALSS